MYEPNSVRGLLNLSKADSPEADASQLLGEMNAYIEELNNWKKQRKEREVKGKVEVQESREGENPEEMNEIEEVRSRNIDLEALKATKSTEKIDIEALIRDFEKPKGYEISESDFQGSDLFAIGQQLKAELQLESDLSGDYRLGKAETVSHSGKTWETVDEIERELRELEQELAEVDLSGAKER